MVHEKVMKQKKDQEKTEEVIPESETRIVIPTVPANLSSPVFDPHTLATLRHLNATVYQPFIDLKNSINSMSEMMRDIIIPVVDFRKNLFESLVEPLRLAQKGLSEYAEQYQRSATLIATIAQSTRVDLIAFRNLVTDFPLADLVKTIDTSTTLSVGFKSAKIIDPQTNSVSFEAVASQRADLGLLHFETQQSLVLKVDRLESKMDTVQTLLADEIYPFLIEDSRRKDNVLEEILAYYKGKPTGFAKVTDIKFIKQTCTLSIDQKDIPLQLDTNEAEVSKIVFNSKSAIKKLWNFDELLERMGERVKRDPLWNKVLYQTARQLNNKIAIKTGLENFLVFTTKTLCVNPIYIKK